MSTIKVTPTTASKINSIDFNNLGFGSVFSDHMLICDYTNGSWGTPEIVPFQPISLMPSAKIFHYGQSIFEGMKAYKDADKKTWLFRPDENFKRFNISAKRLCIPELPEAVFMEGLKALLRVDEQWIPTQDGSSLYIRPIMFATGEGFHASPANAYKFIICTAPSGAYFAGKVKVLIEQNYSRSRSYCLNSKTILSYLKTHTIITDIETISCAKIEIFSINAKFNIMFKCMNKILNASSFKNYLLLTLTKDRIKF